MKVYIAAKLPASHDVQSFIGRVEKHGHEITDAWWDRAWEPKKPEAHKQLASELLEAVDRADAIVLIPPDEGGVGCFIEFGYALGLNKDVHLLRNAYDGGRKRYNRHSSFFHLDEQVQVWSSPSKLLATLDER